MTCAAEFAGIVEWPISVLCGRDVTYAPDSPVMTEMSPSHNPFKGKDGHILFEMVPLSVHPEVYDVNSSRHYFS